MSQRDECFGHSPRSNFRALLNPASIFGVDSPQLFTRTVCAGIPNIDPLWPEEYYPVQTSPHPTVLYITSAYWHCSVDVGVVPSLSTERTLYHKANFCRSVDLQLRTNASITAENVPEFVSTCLGCHLEVLMHTRNNAQHGVSFKKTKEIPLMDTEWV